jgi:hypothetical protein
LTYDLKLSNYSPRAVSKSFFFKSAQWAGSNGIESDLGAPAAVPVAVVVVVVPVFG